MKVLQRYFAINISQAVVFVLVAFLGLISFMDLTSELPSVGKGAYTFQHALLYVALMIPGHVYEVMPVAALIGTIYAMAQFAQSSEFTIMRASSMSTRMAGWMLFKIGIVFVVITFIFGELITPRTAPLAERVRLSAKGATLASEFRSGMWTKDNVHADVKEGGRGAVVGSRFFNARQIRPDGQLLDVRLYEFDNSMRMRAIITAKSASFSGNGTWRLQDVTETLFSNSRTLPEPGAPLAQGQTIQSSFGQDTSAVATRKLASMDLVSEITPKILQVSRRDPERMSANELAVYTRHLAENRQESERFRIAFWKKIVGPLAIFVLMALALPFAYLHTRSGGVSLKIFIGIMIGVSYILINSLFSHLGMLSTWPAFLTAVAPSLLFLLMAILALRWVERH
ncbi:LPS export ABC transporter permease LptG [Massilia sp. Dwa41.01b]|uniref:LPS export ABC transporter permease LptG n=1 Tax=unclassified Massilia TaxID=2609279 RepID=UPI001603341A|nr:MULTISPECIES: LPS export ABC transporter permease LptG [unclassified Massilia]QNA88469.1 LPS export ABC transporter permease LptG [Massilia sp. Dwa41.01b]QNA99364.1 LPS export ABC transporter permease LptG [Massilia sp. Se16.2.3]